MKKILLFICVISGVLFLTSCSSYEDIQDELLTYYNEEWVPIYVWYESEVDEANERVRAIIFEERYENEEVYTI